MRTITAADFSGNAFSGDPLLLNGADDLTIDTPTTGNWFIPAISGDNLTVTTGSILVTSGGGLTFTGNVIGKSIRSDGDWNIGGDITLVGGAASLNCMGALTAGGDVTCGAFLTRQDSTIAGSLVATTGKCGTTGNPKTTTCGGTCTVGTIYWGYFLP